MSGGLGGGTPLTVMAGLGGSTPLTVMAGRGGGTPLTVMAGAGGGTPLTVMAGLVPAIRASTAGAQVAGTSPAMTVGTRAPRLPVPLTCKAHLPHDPHPDYQRTLRMTRILTKSGTTR